MRLNMNIENNFGFNTPFQFAFAILWEHFGYIIVTMGVHSSLAAGPAVRVLKRLTKASGQ